MSAFYPFCLCFSTPHSPTHFNLTSHASHRPFPAVSEDCETLGSRDTIDPSDIVPATCCTILQPGDSDDFDISDDSDATETDDIEDDGDSDGAWSLIGCMPLPLFYFYLSLALRSYISL